MSDSSVRFFFNKRIVVNVGGYMRVLCLGFMLEGFVEGTAKVRA